MAGRSASSVWGEGFVDDSLTDLARVDRWDLVHPDEALRYFPRLVPTARDASLLLALLEQAVAVRWRRRSLHGLHPPLVQSLPAEALSRIGDAYAEAWFPSAGPLRSVLDRMFAERPEEGGAGEDAAMLALDGLLTLRRAGRAAPYTDHLALTLAFSAGIHPAYVWDEALPLHEVATAIGWLGVVARGRPALLPGDIAATLAGSIGESAEATGRLRDQRFARCGLTPSQWGSIGRAARRCLDGKRDIVRLARITRPPRIQDRDLTAATAQRLIQGAIAATWSKRRAT